MNRRYYIFYQEILNFFIIIKEIYYYGIFSISLIIRQQVFYMEYSFVFRKNIESKIYQKNRIFLDATI